MSTRTKSSSDVPGELQLRTAYVAGGYDFALFLGAGVNRHPKKEKHEEAKPRGDWEALLRALHHERKCSVPFDELSRTHVHDWLELASAVVGPKPDFEELATQIDQLIYWKVPRKATQRKSKLLAKSPILVECPTLRAAICFAAQLNDPAKKMSFVPNPRIKAVITTNYDFFFPAGWSRFQETFDKYWIQLKPPSREASAAEGPAMPNWHPSQPVLNEAGKPCRPIFHLHGYIPYDRKGLPGGEWQTRARELILTTEDYERAYGYNSFSRRVLRSVMRKYHLLFLGFSFQDKHVVGVLQEVSESECPEHFAIVTSASREALSGLPVTPVVVEDFAQVPKIIRRVYCAGLKEELDRPNIRQAGLTSGAAYWERVENRLMTRGQKS